MLNFVIFLMEYSGNAWNIRYIFQTESNTSIILQQSLLVLLQSEPEHHSKSHHNLKRAWTTEQIALLFNMERLSAVGPQSAKHCIVELQVVPGMDKHL